MSDDYRCYFLGATPGGETGQAEAVASFRSATDDEAILRAEVKCLRQGGGFELWRANRLVYRKAVVPTSLIA